MLAVVSHDAGGAEVLSSYVLQEGLRPMFVLDGPARSIFERKLGSLSSVSLEEACRCDWLLCGTSWQSDLELTAIASARLAGKRTVAFLDHWVRYRERFVRAGQTCLPDEIWAGDSVSEGIAAAEFPGVTVRLVENPYLRAIQREMESLEASRVSKSDGISVLFVSEPVAEHAQRQHGDDRYWGYVEEDALRYFLRNVSALGQPVERIAIRPHPSELPGKYAWARREFDLPIVQGGVRSLAEEVMDADVVVGCESMALVVGLLAAKRVITCVPPGGRPCALPHTEIIALESLGEANQYAPERLGASS